MLSINNKLYTLFFISILSGCANWNSIHHNNDLNDTSTYVSIDAKQRLMITAERPVYDLNGNKIRSENIICNEPSPDVFSVYTAALEADASKGDELKAGLKLATGESGSTVGIRTQSIQLLRDAMYRICEGYLSGGLTQQSYHRLLSSYQKSMVTLIAIEQLTNAVRPSQVSLTAGSNITKNSDALNAAIENEKTAKSALLAISTSKETNQKELDTAISSLDDAPETNCKDGSPSEVKYKESCAAYVEKKSLVESLVKAENKAKNEYETQQELTKKLTANSSITNNLNSNLLANTQTRLSDSTIVSLSGEIRKLVDDVYKDEVIVTCLESLSSSSNFGFASFGGMAIGGGYGWSESPFAASEELKNNDPDKYNAYIKQQTEFQSNQMKSLETNKQTLESVCKYAIDRYMNPSK